ALSRQRAHHRPRGGAGRPAARLSLHALRRAEPRALARPDQPGAARGEDPSRHRHPDALLPPHRRRRRALHLAGPGEAPRRTGSAPSRDDSRARGARGRPAAARDRDGTRRAVTRRVTLSFDNGPSHRVTPWVLDVLRERGVRSTFFVVGEQLRAPGAAEIARHAAAEGHWIGNHTLTHAVRWQSSTTPRRSIGRSTRPRS